MAQKARAAGFRLYTDLTTPVRHLTPLAVYPAYRRGEWCVVYEPINGQSIEVPFGRSTRIERPSEKLIEALT